MGRHVNRPAGKRRIAKAMRDYQVWREAIDARAAKLIDCAQPVVKEWADDVQQRVEAGEFGVCTQALIRSVVRLCEDFESGHYIGVTKTGGFQCASHRETN